MNSETLVVGRLPLSSNQIYTEERADLTKRDLCEPPHNLREIINNHRSISYFNNASRESILAGDRVVRSKLPESRTFAPNVPTAHCHSEGSGTREDHPRSSPENRPSASQNPLQAVSASSTVQNSQLLSLDYADPKRVPGSDQNIYPRAPISPEFHERYPQLVDFFKQAVDSHKILKYLTSKINYELRLCGSTPSNAVASIIIFCAEAIFKDLRSLLNSKHIRRQYQPKKPSVLNKFQFAPSKPHLQASAPVIAPFKIVFWREATTPTERRSAMEQVVAKSHSFLTMCGSLVRYGDRTSTLGLLISVDSKLYGLTVDHLFKNQRDEVQPTITNEPDILPDEDDIEGNQADWSWVDDVTYEDMDNDRWVSDNGSVTSERSQAEVTMDHGLTEHYGAFINGHKVDSVPEIDTSTPYLDWALIEFDNGYFERPNAFYSEEDPIHPKFFARLSAAPKTSRVHVFMISGVSGTRKGVMLNSNSYIGGKPGETLCQAWNVILSDSGRVIDGDCGSLIVDQETLEVYGHVVASNPLGEAYVVPLQNTFHQISDALGAKDLSLPNPELLMENLITYYSKAGDSGVADEAKLILASMEGLSSTSSQHDVEDEVRSDPAAFLKRNLTVIEELERSELFSVLVRRLPWDTTEAALKSMMVWSEEFIEAEVLSPEKSVDLGCRSAALHFKSHAGALEAKNMLDGKTANDVQVIAEILHGSPTSSRRYTIDNTSTTGPNSTTSSASSTEPTPRQSSNFKGTFRSSQRVSPTNSGAYTSSGLPNHEVSAHYQSLFSPQSPIGNHLNGPPRITDKSLINADSADNDGTGELKDPVAYAENGPSVEAGRPTSPQVLISRMTGLSLNTNAAGPAPISSFINTPQGLSHANPMSPTSNGGPPADYQLGSQHYQRHNFPPVNQAENPPCNTLCVGNLPIDTSEDELKAIFSKQRGYKRLCFRTRKHGLLCFVQFEDVSFATRALHELYEHPLHISIKGGIRLSFSTNPLGVRGMTTPGLSNLPGVMQDMDGELMDDPGGSFSTASGPPPGLSAPLGLSPNKKGYSATMSPMTTAGTQYTISAFTDNSGGLNGPIFTGATAADDYWRK